jgi:ketosteroid isomerase-like protein
MIVLVTIERANVEVGGLPAQDWSLRVTSIFRAEKNEWKLAHRHADPLVEDVSLVQAARLANGQRTPE